MRTPLAIAAILALASCKKDGIPVSYAVTCDRCIVGYVSEPGKEGYASLAGTWSVFISDTIIAADTTYVLDSIFHRAQWSYATTLNHDDNAYLNVTNVFGSKYSHASMEEDGKRTEGEATEYMEFVHLD